MNRSLKEATVRRYHYANHDELRAHIQLFLLRCFADRAYAGPRVAAATSIAITLVGSLPGQRGFAVQPRRWIVERTFAWAGRCRRPGRSTPRWPTPSPSTSP